MVNKISKIEPQIILHFNSNRKVKRIVFLTFGDIDDNSFVYNTLTYLKTSQPNGFEDNVTIEIINDHIFVSLKLNYVRGYIRNLLKIQENIVIFSIWNNIDYEYSSIDIFNPFLIKSDITVKEVSDNVILYEIYKNVCLGGIFCVVEESSLKKKHLARGGTYLPKISYYVNKIIPNITKNNFELLTTIKENKDYINNLKYKHIVRFLNIESYNPNYKTVLSWQTRNSIFLSGNKLTITNNSPSKDLYVYDESDNNICSFFNEIVVINNEDKFWPILKLNINDFKDLDIKKSKHKFIIIVNFNVFLPPKINLDYEFDFLIEETKKTRNIFLDPTKKINIITSKDHISFRSSILYSRLSEYFSLMIS